MKRSFVLLSVLTLTLSTTACSKNKCKLDSAEKKQAFGTLADMTAGAFTCDIDGDSDHGSEFFANNQCTLGTPGCTPVMHAIHPKTTVAVVAPQYKDFLEKHQWPVVREKKVSGKFGNGKPYEGLQVFAQNGGETLGISIVPFGDDMVETTTMRTSRPLK